MGAGLLRSHPSGAGSCPVPSHWFLLPPPTGGVLWGSPANSHGLIFRVHDVQLWIGSRALDVLTCPETDLTAATFVTLTFTTQKNGVRNETIDHGRSGDAHLCPILAVAARLVALRRDGVTADSTLNAVRGHTTMPFSYVLASHLTARIRAAHQLHHDPAYAISDVSICSTRTGGAIALLCAGVDSNRIHLIGRWQSDEMYLYMHVQAQPVINGLAAAMLRGGSFHITPF